ncbi:hypothetical protein KEJ50_03455 [Candidatus Bathyarchaeota archaeon]|nr:hypothetical protein [Candidatus Bathyarchaeota archaeon]
MKSLTLLGLLLIILGLTLIALTYLINRFSSISIKGLKKIPKILVYIYKKNNITFITSPILIIIGLAYFIWLFLKIIHK